jgi:hypothetical protein
MPRPKARRSGADEDPKSRVSKYRKREPSMYSKAEKFARDTDVQMMALLTVDKNGKCRSFAAGEQRNLVPIMREIRVRHHFLEYPGWPSLKGKVPFGQSQVP